MFVFSAFTLWLMVLNTFITIDSVILSPLVSTQNLSLSFGHNGASWSVGLADFCSIAEYMDKVEGLSYFMVDGYYIYNDTKNNALNSSINANIYNEYVVQYNNSNNLISKQLPFYLQNYGINNQNNPSEQVLSRTPSTCTHKQTGNIFVAYWTEYNHSAPNSPKWNIIEYKIFINNDNLVYNNSYWTDSMFIPSDYKNTTDYYGFVYNVICMDNGFFIAWIENRTSIHYRIVNINGNGNIIDNNTLWINDGSNIYAEKITSPLLIQSAFNNGNSFLFVWNYYYTYTMAFNFDPTTYKFTQISSNPIRMKDLGDYTYSYGPLEWELASLNINDSCCYIVVLNNRNDTTYNGVVFMQINIVNKNGYQTNMFSLPPKSPYIAISLTTLNMLGDEYFMLTYNVSYKLIGNIYRINNKTNNVDLVINSTELTESFYPFRPYGVCAKSINNNLFFFFSTYLTQDIYSGLYAKSFKVTS